MIRCGICSRWTPGINGICADCYEGAWLEFDVETSKAIDFVRAQERAMDAQERATEEKPAE